MCFIFYFSGEQADAAAISQDSSNYNQDPDYDPNKSFIDYKSDDENAERERVDELAQSFSKYKLP